MQTASWVVLFIPIVSIICVFWMIGLSISRSARVREMQIKERIALIEKGVIPPPELNPAVHDGELSASEERAARRAAALFRSVGITIIGIGLAVGLIIAVAGDHQREGFGIGGAIAILGVALLVNGVLTRPSSPGRPERRTLSDSEPRAGA